MTVYTVYDDMRYVNGSAGDEAVDTHRTALLLALHRTPRRQRSPSQAGVGAHREV
jgi:hypothetical protein